MRSWLRAPQTAGFASGGRLSDETRCTHKVYLIPAGGRPLALRAWLQESRVAWSAYGMLGCQRHGEPLHYTLKRMRSRCSPGYVCIRAVDLPATGAFTCKAHMWSLGQAAPRAPSASVSLLTPGDSEAWVVQMADGASTAVWLLGGMLGSANTEQLFQLPQELDCRYEVLCQSMTCVSWLKCMVPFVLVQNMQCM